MEEKRGQGRPRKDEVVINEDDLKRPVRRNTKQELKRAEKAYKTAEKVYKAYESDKPNPLNLEFTDLSEEAKVAWTYIYSKRKVDVEDVGILKPTFHSIDEFIFLYQCFCAYIVRNKFIVDDVAVTPSFFDFSRWLGVTPRTVEAHYEAHAGEKERKTVEALRADVLFKGAASKVYEKTITIFAMKNWCNWADKQEVKTETDGPALTQEEIEERLHNLGYSREKLELVK